MWPTEVARFQHDLAHGEVLLRLDPELFWFDGHFPAQPILPGLAQLDWVMGYGEKLLGLTLQFQSIQNVKFQSPLLPGDLITLSLNWQEKNRILIFDFRRHENDDRVPVSSGKLRFVS